MRLSCVEVWLICSMGQSLHMSYILIFVDIQLKCLFMWNELIFKIESKSAFDAFNCTHFQKLLVWIQFRIPKSHAGAPLSFFYKVGSHGKSNVTTCTRYMNWRRPNCRIDIDGQMKMCVRSYYIHRQLHLIVMKN